MPDAQQQQQQKKKPPPRPKKLPPYQTRRPAPDDPTPVACYRYGATVLLRYLTIGPAVLTPAEARTLAAVLIREADLAEATPAERSRWPATRTRQLPDGDDSAPM